ncbi:hypothetical protein GOP47_0026147 [Adiantum capillus-veneris]|uniref:Uncharacterized protein n=1 Tax=Adiantum capillus-veneris TaxID=13818 RepID=A0A9D4Z2N2_ADICA|nr:hypothetical protein GOP47_0026147 [Adiantum capillus-veneris]
MYEEHVGLAIQHVDIGDKVLQGYAMILVDMLLKIALQGVMHWLCYRHEVDCAMEFSLASRKASTYDTGASSDAILAYDVYEILWVHDAKDLCYQRHGWPTYGFVGGSKGWDMSYLQVKGYGQCHQFDPGGDCHGLCGTRCFAFYQGGVHILLDGILRFPFDPEGCADEVFFLYLYLRYAIAIYPLFFCHLII